MGEAYFLMPYGYNIEQLNETTVSGTELAEKLKAIKAKKLLLLLDCCHAGGLTDLKAAGLQLAKAPMPPEAQCLMAQGLGRAVIASSKAGEFSFAGKPYSAFTLALIEALCGIGASQNDGFVRVTDLALHAREMVPRRTKDRQHPILNYEQADNFVLAYYAGGETQPKSLPFNQEPEIEPAPGAWCGVFDQRSQTIHGPQTNITGNVQGPLFSGIFRGPVNVGSIEVRKQDLNQEMDFISFLYSYRRDLETLEPIHVDPNDLEKEKEISNFWREVEGKKYLASRDVRDILNRYLEIIAESGREVRKVREILCELISEELVKLPPGKEIKDFTELGAKIDCKNLNLFKNKIIPQLGGRLFIKAVPTEDRLKTKYKQDWDQIRSDLERIHGRTSLYSQVCQYIDIFNKDQFSIIINGNVEKNISLLHTRFEITKMIEKRHKQLEEERDRIR
jgi:hypothetical protein